MKAKTALFGMFAALAFIALGIALILAATGFVRIPVLNSLLGTDGPRDLGVAADPAALENLLRNQNVQLSGSRDNMCLDCHITYSGTAPMDVSVSSAELTSLLRATNDAQGTIKDLQVKLGTDNRLEASGLLDLKRYGYDFSGPVYAAGKIEKHGTGAIRLIVEKGEAGLVPVPAEYSQKFAAELENAINTQLGRMPGFSIDDVRISDGQLHYKGEFPRGVSA